MKRERELIEGYKTKLQAAGREKEQLQSKLSDTEASLRICKSELECKRGLLVALQTQTSAAANYNKEVLVNNPSGPV